MCSPFHKDKKCNCLVNGTGPCNFYDPSYLIKKVCSLFKDDFGCKMIKRHCSLINDYIKASKSGILLKDIPFLLYTLEYLATHAPNVPEYGGLLYGLLELCHLPPVVQYPAEGHFHMCEMEQFFNLFGYLIALLRDETLQRSVLRVIQCQLTRYEPVGLTCVKVKLCLLAMESSNLASTVGQLLEVVPTVLYPALLDLALLLASLSTKCSQKMVSAGGLNAILLRLNSQYPQQPQHPSTEAADVSNVACSALWALLRAIQIADADTAEQWQAPSLKALRSLQYALRDSTLHYNKNMRNTLVGIVLLSLEVFPELLIIETGLAEDLIVMSVMGEVHIEDSWVADVPLSTSQQDFELKRLLMLVNCYLLQYPAAIQILLDRHVILSLLHLLDPSSKQHQLSWTRSQQWALLNSSLQTLSMMAQQLPDEVVSQGGAIKLLLLLDWYMQQQYDEAVLHHSLRTLFHLVVTLQPSLMNDIYDHRGITIILCLCQYLVDKPTMSTSGQKTLMLGFLLLELLCRNQRHLQEQYGEAAIKLTVSLLSQVVYNKSGDLPIDDRMVIAAVDFLWEAVVWCPTNCQTFVSSGGMYTLLDMLQMSIFPIQLMLLGVLVDLCEQGACIPQLVTWRAKDSKTGYLPLLVKIWREEERQLSVHRTSYGSVQDIELPLMGEEQWYQTFYCKKDPNTSPAITDIYGSARPKIYAIIQLMNYRHQERVKESEEYYQMFHNVLDASEQITLQVMKNYLALKMGEVWVEVAHDLQTVGIQPLEMDGRMVGVLLEQQLTWAAQVQALQHMILHDDIQQDLFCESKFYQLVRDCGLAHKLRALQELELVASTTDKHFFDQQKQRERDQVTVTFPEDIPPQQCHRTYDPSQTFKMVLHQSARMETDDECPKSLLETSNWDWFHLDHSKCQFRSHCADNE